MRKQSSRREREGLLLECAFSFIKFLCVDIQKKCLWFFFNFFDSFNNVRAPYEVPGTISNHIIQIMRCVGILLDFLRGQKVSFHDRLNPDKKMAIIKHHLCAKKDFIIYLYRAATIQNRSPMNHFSKLDDWH